ncbi:putative acetyltransferase [Paraburkholderia bannensis]|uniref:Putative acetyltransferase n=1 Tax=Paraburkholderia bannensis TaxID=765414 RepID=A0A7W9TZ38_9BURK|nr:MULTISPECIES: GNAT family N-acetyltransferase [Paraburkholderia]MBB3259058.1 putative acetyltransferase [Paraburkholderia sp. WP4_3_2]MBB6104073.1 putative acetyltransferase [Paraburkholderia bannensis]
MNRRTDAFTARSAFAQSVRLRAAELDDCQAMADLMNLPGVRRGTLSHGYRTAEGLRAWLENSKVDRTSIVAEHEGRVIGQAELMAHDGRRSHCASLGIGVHDAFQGRGVGALLMGALIDAADTAFGLRRIELQVFADNAPAIGLYRRFGFEVEARARAYAIRDGALHDVLHMARLAPAPAFAGAAEHIEPPIAF